MRFALICPVLLAVASCGGGSESVVRAPAEFPRFPDQTNSGIVWTEATYYTNHDDIFDTDLVRGGLLPVALRIGLRGDDDADHRLSESFDAHLYLQDGTALRWVPSEQIEISRKSTIDQIARRSLDMSLLDDWRNAREGFLFFRLPSDRVKVRGTRVLSSDDLGQRELDLLGSLISFTVTTRDGDTQIFVGMKSERWSGGNGS